MSTQTRENVHIAISGLIGVGKTTLAKDLSQIFNVPLYLEPVETNEYLKDFYEDQEKHGFAMQVYLLCARYKQQQEIVWKGAGGIQDRSIYEDIIFADMLCQSGKITSRDFKTYRTLLSLIKMNMKSPMLIIHLDITPEESLRRIRSRGRDCEKSITLDYLTKLRDTYEVHLAELSKTTPIFRIDWEKFGDSQEVAKMVLDAYNKTFNMHRI